MLYCNLQVFFCTEIAVEKHFDPRNVTSGGASGGGLNRFSRLAIARHILGPLVNYAVIRPLALINKTTDQKYTSSAKKNQITFVFATSLVSVDRC